MKSREALRRLAEITESQWGMVTSAQARALGMSHMNLSRLAQAGDIVRLAHGVYRDAGSPSRTNEDLVAAWLAAEPKRLAFERLKERPASVVVSGESAALLHGMGDFRATQHEFTTSTRRQTQREDVKYRTRTLPKPDVTIREGLPVTTRERTISDLIEDRHDLSLVADALRDAARQSPLDTDRLVVLLSPLAERNGHAKEDGTGFLESLLKIAGIDLDSLARMIASWGELRSRINAQFIKNLPSIENGVLSPEMTRVMKKLAETTAQTPTDKQLKKQLEPLLRVVEAGSPIMEASKKITAGFDGTKLQEQLKEVLPVFDSVSLSKAINRQTGGGDQHDRG